MPLNPFFNKFAYAPEQSLHQDLIVEAISIFGVECYYIPRQYKNYDKLYNTDDQSTYQSWCICEVYMENPESYGGQGDLFQKFGLHIKDQLTLSMASRTFKKEVNPLTGQNRPEEGDIIYFPIAKKCFQIVFVENKEFFYPRGYLPTFKMTLELMEYSDETFNTGIPEIDIVQKLESLNILDYVYTTESGIVLTDKNLNRLTVELYDPQNIDVISDNDELKKEDINNNIFDFSEINPFGEVETK